MLVNAAVHPGPALWQGLMMLAMPLFLWGALYKDGKYIRQATIGYVGLGVLLMFIV